MLFDIRIAKHGECERFISFLEFQPTQFNTYVCDVFLGLTNRIAIQEWPQDVI